MGEGKEMGLGAHPGEKFDNRGSEVEKKLPPSFAEYAKKLESLGYKEEAQKVMDIENQDEEAVKREIAKRKERRELEKKEEIKRFLPVLIDFINPEVEPSPSDYNTEGIMLGFYLGENKRSLISLDNIDALKELLGAYQKGHEEDVIQLWRTEIPYIGLEINNKDQHINLRRGVS